MELREGHRREMNCQILHDSLHTRRGWTETYLLENGGKAAGFGSIAIGGPWKDKRAYFELYITPEYRGRGFDLFEAFLASAQPQYFEVQTNDLLTTTMALTYGRVVETEAIVFQDKIRTCLPRPAGAVLKQTTPRAEILSAMEERGGGGEWTLEIGGNVAAKGGVLFHYNQPFGDIYMEVEDRFRQQGLGSYLVQELKRITYELGAVPAARCNATNVPSRRTLQRAGFVPVGAIINGKMGAEGV